MLVFIQLARYIRAWWRSVIILIRLPKWKEKSDRGCVRGCSSKSPAGPTKTPILSGGECHRQPLRALLIKPRILVCDEMTSALDMTIQAELMRLMRGLKEQYDEFCLYLPWPGIGQPILSTADGPKRGAEQRTRKDYECLSNPRDPYTQELLATIGSKKGGWVDVSNKL